MSSFQDAFTSGVSRALSGINMKFKKACGGDAEMKQQSLEWSALFALNGEVDPGTIDVNVDQMTSR